MAYCTASDLDSGMSDLGQAQTTAETGSTVDATVLAQVIADASSKMDAYLMGRYTVPITGDSTALAILRSICVPIAVYLLYKRRLIKNAEVIADYERAIEELKMIKEDGGLPGAGSPVIGTEPTVEDYEPIVGSESQVYGKDLQLY